jgi:uncharacterized protein (DUF1697 family)
VGLKLTKQELIVIKTGSRMTIYISILRGINVGGSKKILMKDLEELYVELGFADVRTYIQSGNVLFRSAKDIPDKEIAGLIKQAISRKFGFDVPVIIRSLDEMEKAIQDNPFVKDKTIEGNKLHVTFLSDPPDTSAIAPVSKLEFAPDKFIISGREIYLHCPFSYGETKLSNSFFESKLKVTATTRNWNTINKLIEMARGL